jgi:hypothetical protein
MGLERAEPSTMETPNMQSLRDQLRAVRRGSKVTVGGLTYRCWGTPAASDGVEITWRALCPKCSRDWWFTTARAPKAKEFPKQCPDCHRRSRRSAWAKRANTIKKRQARGELTE